ncbi:MAG: DUF4926 domain-containing protein [bacterium]|nr:DUF4926 domain-containing protein [bacterium]
MLQEFERVALQEDLPEHGLKAGDIATIVDIHQNGKGYTLEFVSLGGKTIAIVTVFAAQVRPLEQDEVPHARKLEPS